MSTRKLSRHRAISLRVSYSSVLIVTGLEVRCTKLAVQTPWTGLLKLNLAPPNVLIFRRQDTAEYHGTPLRQEAPDHLQKLIKRITKSGLTRFRARLKNLPQQD